MNLNRELHEALGYCCPDISDFDDGGMCGLCGECYEAHNIPDYAADPRLVLREMMKRVDWDEFVTLTGAGVIANTKNGTVYCIDLFYILDDSGKLRDLAIEFLEGSDERD
jgi:hypothetical protein